MQKVKIDPRHYQLAVQGILLAWGMAVLQFPVTPVQVMGVVAGALAVQVLFCRLYRLNPVWLSTFNTAFSVLLLLHAQDVSWLVVAAVVGVASKFLLRLDGRHVFNPSNIGIVASLLLSDAVWVAPGQWGHGLWWFLLLAGLGLSVWIGWRALLSTGSFLAVYVGFLWLRAGWLGDPWSIPLHQMQNGSLLLFSFFMLADPITTPAHPGGRVIFGVLIALAAVWLQFHWYIPNAFLYALAMGSPLVFVLNRWLNYPAFVWSQVRNGDRYNKQEEIS